MAIRSRLHSAAAPRIAGGRMICNGKRVDIVSPYEA